MDLDSFLQRETLLPGRLFLRECEEEVLRKAWYGLAKEVCGPAGLLPQLEEAMHASRPLPAEGVHPICDPDRVRYLREVVDGTNAYRKHLESLVEHEKDSLVAAQTCYMKEAILTTFPPEGLQTTSLAELVALFLLEVST